MLWGVGDYLYSNRLPLALMQVLAVPHWFLLIGMPLITIGVLINRVWWGITLGFIVALILLLLPVVDAH